MGVASGSDWRSNVLRFRLNFIGGIQSPLKKNKIKM